MAVFVEKSMYLPKMGRTDIEIRVLLLSWEYSEVF